MSGLSKSVALRRGLNGLLGIPGLRAALMPNWSLNGTGVASSALINYLQEECEARFADLSFLKKWYKVRTASAVEG